MRELSQHVLDLIQNSLEAGASQVEIEIIENRAANQLTLSVADNGRGMDEETVRRVTDPFYTTRTTRHVGLGLPLLQAAAERCGGGLIITSRPGEGTRVVADFDLDHIDRAPLGDMKDTLIGALLSEKGADIVYRHRLDDREMTLDTREIREILGEDIPLSHPMVRSWLLGYLDDEFAALYDTASRITHKGV
ncbi:MAG: ATP-binding protein [Anaerolineae bacterium]